MAPPTASILLFRRSSVIASSPSVGGRTIRKAAGADHARAQGARDPVRARHPRVRDNPVVAFGIQPYFILLKRGAGTTATPAGRSTCPKKSASGGDHAAAPTESGSFGFPRIDDRSLPRVPHGSVPRRGLGR